MLKASSLLVALVYLGFTSASAQAVDYNCSVLYELADPPGVDGVNGEFDIANGASVGSGHIPEAHDGQNYALSWTSSGTPINLNPFNQGIALSAALATDGISQVGEGYPSMAVGAPSYALLWTGTADSAVNLNPAGFISSVANGVSGNQQVGQGTNASGNSVALLWNGTAASAISLNPPGYKNCGITATDGVNQVGYGDTGPLLWSGSAASAVNLTPTELPNIKGSTLLSVSGNQQVGYGMTSTNLENAIVWNGTGASAVDLNPAGYFRSAAEGTNGSVQVGFGRVDDSQPNHALAWFGTADSVVDLQTFLTDAGASSVSSEAYSVDANGNIFGIAHATINNLSGYYAVEWSPVPEPGTIALVAVFMAALHRFRRL